MGVQPQPPILCRVDLLRAIKTLATGTLWFVIWMTGALGFVVSFMFIALGESLGDEAPRLAIVGAAVSLVWMLIVGLLFRRSVKNDPWPR